MDSSEPQQPLPGDEDDDSEEDDPLELSGFDRIKNNFVDLERLISEIYVAFGSPGDLTSNSVAGNNISDVNSNNGTANGVDPAAIADKVDTNAGRRMEKVRKDMTHIRKNVEYIKNNVEQLRSSSYSDGADELLRYLMDAAEKRTVDDFPPDSDNLKHLLHIIAKLKHWVPPQRKVADDSNKKKKQSNKEKKESPIVSKEGADKVVADIVKTLVSYQPKDWGMDGLLRSYGELKVRDKLCLLCFSVFICGVDKFKKEKEKIEETKEKENKEDAEKEEEKKEETEKEEVKEEKKEETDKEKEGKEKGREKEVFLVQKNLVIKKKILIYWWVGEGFIQPTPSSNKNSTTNTDPQNIPTPDEAGPNPSSTSTNADPQGNPNPNHGPITDGNQISEQVWPPPEDEGKTIEQIGENILNVLREKGFIEPVMKRGRETGSYQMLPFVHAFVTALAKKDGFFDFSNADGKLTHRFALSQRACLVKSRGKLPSSCRVWKEAIDNRDTLKKFATVQTLFNVNEAIIDIQPEWFSKMKYLSVLHLGSWRSEAGEHIEVEDPKFMEELKNMKQLKLFSLQGVATIMKLPDSVCELSNLIILDLRECHNLEQLPAKIGELKNLTHLDLTNCHLLTKLPKGISLLSKLQVLNWFVIYNQDGEKEAQRGCMSKAWKKTKGFVVHDVFRYENTEVCTLKDLLKLGSLRELSIVVNRNEFPSEYEAEVLMKMRELCTLKISWVYDFDDKNKDTNSSVVQEGQANSNDTSSTEPVQEGQANSNDTSSTEPVQEGQANSNDTNSTEPVQIGQDNSNDTNSAVVQNGQDNSNGTNSAVVQNGQDNSNDTNSTEPVQNGQDTQQVQPSSKCGSCFCCKKSEEKTQEGKDTSQMRFEKLEKLELWCYPGKKLPDWLVPDKLDNLKKLYIKGGKLASLGEDKKTWKVEMLSLKYMMELKIEWRELTAKFPHMTYLEKFQCKKLGLFPCDHEGVWINKEKIANCAV